MNEIDYGRPDLEGKRLDSSTSDPACNQSSLRTGFFSKTTIERQVHNGVNEVVIRGTAVGSVFPEVESIYKSYGIDPDGEEYLVRFVSKECLDTIKKKWHRKG